jgi:hypothetical protein
MVTAWQCDEDLSIVKVKRGTLNGNQEIDELYRVYRN